MGKSNTELLKIAEKHLGQGGSVFRKFCGLPSGAPYCNAFVDYIAHEGDDSALYFAGKKYTYCPDSMAWCRKNLAQIPIYLALPMDIIYFDWELNGVPNHIGFVRERKSDAEICTIEGNTSKLNSKGQVVATGVVAERTRTVKYVQGVYRPHFSPTGFDANKRLDVDGQFGYHSIAVMQRWLGVKADGILGRQTIIAMQKKLGVTQDGSWGKGTSKALQKVIGTAADGAFGEKSVKALQGYLNDKVFGNIKPTPIAPTTKPQSPTESSDKLDVDGSIGKKTILRMQEFFGTLKDGIISGQKESLYKYYPSIEKEQIRFCEGGSICIVKLQTWLGVTADGVLGKDTVKAWQKKLGVKADGCFGTNSAKAWQKYLNEHDKAVYPSKSSGSKIAEKASELAYAGFPKEAKYPSGHAKEAYRKALDKVFPNRSSWSKAARLGASCDVYVGTCVRASGADSNFPRGLKEQLPYMIKSPKFVEVSYKRSNLRTGDIVIYKRKGAGQHIFIVKNDSLHICEANYESTYGITRTTKESIDYKLKTDNKEWIRIFRAKA